MIFYKDQKKWQGKIVQELPVNDCIKKLYIGSKTYNSNETEFSGVLGSPVGSSVYEQGCEILKSSK